MRHIAAEDEKMLLDDRKRMFNASWMSVLNWNGNEMTRQVSDFRVWFFARSLPIAFLLGLVMVP